MSAIIPRAGSSRAAARRSGRDALRLVLLVLALLVAAPSVAGCGAGEPGEEPSPSMANGSASDVAAAATLDALAGAYVDARTPGVRFVLYDDRRFIYWDGANVIEGRWTLQADTATVEVPAVGELTWDAASGRLSGGLDDGPDRLYLPLRGELADLGHSAKGRSLSDLHAELAKVRRLLDEMAQRETISFLDATLEPEPAAVSNEELAGTYRCDESDVLVTLNADGTCYAGTGLASETGEYTVTGLQVTFFEAMEDESSVGVTAMGDYAQYDPDTRTFLDCAGRTWRRTDEESDPYRAF